MVNKIKRIVVVSQMLGLTFSTTIYSQTRYQAENFQLNLPLGQNCIYEAKNEVRMKDGFTFKSGTGVAFDALINSSLTGVPVDGGNGDLSQGIASGYEQLATGDAPPGTLPGSVDVGPTGAATYSIPLDLPKGLGGIAPQLAITYSSQSGDGLLGRGWNLSCLSAITRATQTYYYDNTSSGVTFTNNDRFMLDGQRLIVTSGTNGTDGCKYAKEAFDFSEITSNGSFYSGPDYFVVKTKDNTIITYGEGDAKVYVPGTYSQRVAIWLIKQITDRRGNWIKFFYNNPDGQIKVTRIDYTGNDNAGITTPPSYVTFQYGTFTNGKQYYQGGYLFTSDLKLTSITLSDTKKYSFGYNSDERLAQINLYKGTDLMCNPTLIDWGSVTDNFQFNNPVNDASNADYMATGKFMTVPCDINNDGKTEIVQLSNDPNNNAWRIYSINNNSMVELSHGTLPTLNVCTTSETSVVNFKNENHLYWTRKLSTPYDIYVATRRLPLTLFDFDRDGIPELCIYEANKASFPDFFNFRVYRYTGGTFVLDNSFNKDNLAMPDYASQFIMGNFSGNGNPDLFLNNGSSSFNSLNTYAGLSGLGDYYSVINFDNDGKDDILTTYPITNGPPTNPPTIVTGLQVLETDNPSTGSAYDFSSICVLDSVFPSEILPGDYNGDGLTDVLLYNYYKLEWQLYFSDGKGSFIKCTSDISNIAGTPGENTFLNPDDYDEYQSYIDAGHPELAEKLCKRAKVNTYRVADINNDGKADMIQTRRPLTLLNNIPGNNRPVMEYDQSVIVYYSTDNGFDRYNYNSGQLIYNNSLTRDYKIPENTGLLPGAGHMPADWGPMDFRQNNYEEDRFMLADLNNDGFIELLYVDGNGQFIYTDGSTDVYYGALFNFKSGIAGNMITKITNGMGIFTNITYNLLSNDAVYTHAPTGGLGTGILELRLPFKVVSNTYTRAIVYGSDYAPSNINYTYNTLRVHTLKGHMGFKTFTAKNTTNGGKTITNYSIDPTYYVPYVSSVDNYVGSIYLSNSAFTYSFIDKSNNKYLQYLSNSTSTDKLTNTTTSVAISVDDATGNTTDKTETYGSDGSVVTGYSGFDDYGQPQTITTTRNQGSGSFTAKQYFTYFANGNVNTSTDNNGIVTTYTYMPDNTNVYTIANSGTNTVVTYTYDNSMRFVTKTENKFSNNAVYTATAEYDNDGRPIRAVDKNGLVAASQYDKFGNKIIDLKANGRRTAYKYGWCSVADKPEIVSYSQVTEENGSIGKTYYDCLGRAIRKISQPAGGSAVTVTYNYDNYLGQLISEISSADGITSYTYYDDLRLQSVSAKGRTVNYSYASRRVSTTINGITTSKTFNAFGQVAGANDGGGSVSYVYHPSGQPLSITTNGKTVSMDYDAKGRQTKLTDPDAGITNYTYDNLSRLWTQTDANGNLTTMNYDPVYGRLTSKVQSKGSTTRTIAYTYDPDISHLGYMSSEEDQQSGVKTSYVYDRLGNITSKTDKISSIDYTFGYEYDLDGKLVKTTYPDGIIILQSYNGEYLNSVKDDATGTNLFSSIQYDARDQLNSCTLGNGNTVTNVYDTYGYINTSTFGPAGSQIQNTYAFDAAWMNLMSRSKKYLATGIQKSESFTYDNLDRLKNWTVGAITYSMNYAANGNIVQKSDMGYYGYSATQPHAISTISQLSGTSIDSRTSNITYNLFGKTETMNRKNGSTIENNYTIIYGPDDERRKTNLDGNITLYSGPYEKRANGDILHYINGVGGAGALLVTNSSGRRDMYYLYTDNLGSLTAVANQAGAIIKEFSYDPWGRRRNPTDWNDYTVTADNLGTGGTQLFTRGYTMHEHLDVFGLINMNGRMYDPRLGRFLSPDNVVQDPTGTQGYNRYSYCINNPLKYSDPSGWSYGYTFTWPGGGFSTDNVEEFNQVVHNYYNGNATPNSWLPVGWQNGCFGLDQMMGFPENCSNSSANDKITAAYNSQASGTYASYGVSDGNLVKDYESSSFIVRGDGNGNGSIEAGGNISILGTGAYTQSIYRGSYASRLIGEMNYANYVASARGDAINLVPMQSIYATSVSAAVLPSGFITSSPKINIENNDEVSINVAQLVYTVAAAYVGKKVYYDKCSDWVEKVYSICENGFEVHKRANDFADHDELVATTNPVPGDIPQWDRSPNTGHVAIYAGDNQIITTTKSIIQRLTIDQFRSGQPTRYLHYVGN